MLIDPSLFTRTIDITNYNRVYLYLAVWSLGDYGIIFIIRCPGEYLVVRRLFPGLGWPTYVETIPLDGLVSELRGQLNNFNKFTEVKRWLVTHLGKIAHN